MSFCFKELVVHDNAGGDNLDNVTPNDALGLLGIFHLLAYGNTMSGADQLWQVVVQLVVRKTGQRHISGGAVVAFCERDPACSSRYHGIITERLEEITEPEQQDCVRIPPLNLAVLTHERSF